MASIKSIVFIAMIAMVGLFMTSLAISGPVALLSTGDELTADEQITLKINALTTNSPYINMRANVPLGVVGYTPTLFDLVLDFEGGDLTSDVFIERGTVAQSAMSFSSQSYENNHKVSNKKQIKVDKLQWPELSSTTSRSIGFRAKIANISKDGFKVTGGSLTVNGKTEKVTFAPVVSRMSTLFATLEMNIKPEKQASVFDPILAPLSFSLRDIKLPSPTDSKVTPVLRDLLGNASFSGPTDGKCTLNDKAIKTRWDKTGAFFFEVENWSLLTKADIKCEGTKFDLGKNKDSLHVWVVDFLSTNDVTYQTEVLTGGDFVEKGGSFPKIVIYVIIAIVVIAALVGIVFALKAAKIGPFKPKEADQFTTGLVGDDNQYQAFN